MTNKLEISREQLEIAAHRLSDLGQSHLSEPIFALLLAAPAVERQEPIYQVKYRGDGGGGWSDAEKSSYDAKVPHPEHWMTRIVYTSPPAPVAVVLPEPFAWYTEDYLTDKSATTYDMPTAERWKAKGWPVQPMYISPYISPAKAFAKGFNTLETGDGKYKIVMQFAGRDDAWAAYKELSQMTVCLDKVKKMNQI